MTGATLHEPGGNSTGTRLDIDRQGALLRTGYAQLDGLWSQDHARALAQEARMLRRFARVPDGPAERPQPPVVASRVPDGDTRTTINAPVLSSIHLELMSLARALTGRLLVPSFALYRYHDENDGVRLHVDAEGCELTLLAAAYGHVGPLRVHPQLWGSSLVELETRESAPDWNDEGGTAIPYPALGVIAQRGGVLPHHRPARPVAAPCAVAALHYCSLF